MENKFQEIETICGRKARIYAVNCGSKYPIHGAVYSIDGQCWLAQQWTTDGTIYGNGIKSDEDLKELPQ